MTGFYKSYSNAMDLHIPASKLGAPTNPMVAKQLDEFGKLLNQGIKNIEIGTIDPTKFEQIPVQHFDEVRRLAKLTDSHPSVHAPLLDLAGFPTQEGERGWKEEQRESTENQVFSILERSFRLSNGENVPIVFHAGRTKTQEYGKPWDPSRPEEKGYKIETIKDGKRVILPSPYKSIMAVNQDTGEMTKLDYEEKYRVGEKEIGKVPDVWDPFKKLKSINSVQWDDEKLKLLQHQKEIGELKEKFELKIKQNEAIEKTGLKNIDMYKNVFESNGHDIELLHRHLNEINRKMSSDYENTYDKFVRFGKEKADSKKIEEINKMNEIHRQIEKEIRKREEDQQKLYDEMQKTKSNEKRQEIHAQIQQKEIEKFNLSLEQSKAAVTAVAGLPTPDIWRPANEFAMEKTTDTVANAIAKMYKKVKQENPGKESTIPFIALENFFVDTPMSRGKDLKAAVIEARKKLADKLADECSLSKEKAAKEAEKLIGATWDVGHINNLRKSGYEGEELKKEVLRDTKEVADVVKHVHITDNFGFFDSHLPPGMGNVPIREIMENLEKTWAEMAKEGRLPQTPRGIVEAGGFVAEIGQNPTIGILEYFGSPLYKISPSPYFSSSAGRTVGHTYSPYFESFIDFPQQHFNLYGSSFTTLPKSVGGQVGGETSRFSGTPNQ